MPRVLTPLDLNKKVFHHNPPRAHIVIHKKENNNPHRPNRCFCVLEQLRTCAQQHPPFNLGYIDKRLACYIYDEAVGVL